MKGLKSLFNKKQEKADKNIVDFLDDSNYLTNELRFQHQPMELQVRASEDKKVTLGMLLNKTYDVRKEEVSDMGIVSNYFDKQFELVRDREAIWNYDLCKAILKIDEQGKIGYKHGENVVLTISYRKYGAVDVDMDKSISRSDESIIVHLRGTGGGHDSWFICATILMPVPAYEKDKTYAINQNKPRVLSVTFAYDKTDPKERIARYNYLKEDAFEKLEQEKYNEITEEQEWLLNQLKVNVGQDYWWGNKVFQEKRFWDAIIYFENVFQTLRDGWKRKLTEEEADIFFKTCYRLGYCYSELQLYEKALFYLSIMCPSCDKISYNMEYINCLVNSKDFRAMIIICDELDRVEKLPKEEVTEEVSLYYNFLRRRFAYTYVDMGKLEEAENIFKEMLNEEANKDFALHELAYLQGLKERTNNNN